MATADRSVRHIGAHKKMAVIDGSKQPDGIRPGLYDVTWDFSKDPVALPDGYDGYHRKLIRDGALFPADEATAKAVGVKFRPYDEAIAAEHKAQAEHWRLRYGEDLPGYIAPLAAVEEKETDK